MKKSLLLLFMFLCVFGLNTAFSLAQVRETDIVFRISPENPAPGEMVQATLTSYVINLDKASISWSFNNTDMGSGVGKKSISFITDTKGTPSYLSVLIDTIDGQSVSKSITVGNATVDVLWEAYNVYSPPFYRGKTLVPSQGMFKVVAIPSITSDGSRVNQNNLSYTWKEGGKTRPDSSGWGKDYFIFQNGYLEKNNVVEVRVSDVSGQENVSGSLNLKTSQPKIVFYESDSGLGIKWENALKDKFPIDTIGTTIVAEPYFFSPKNIDSSDLKMVWSLGNEEIKDLNPKNVLSIKSSSEERGETLMKLVVENTKTLFQQAVKELNVLF